MRSPVGSRELSRVFARASKVVLDNGELLYLYILFVVIALWVLILICSILFCLEL
jgi:hypothetical protein